MAIRIISGNSLNATKNYTPKKGKKWIIKRILVTLTTSATSGTRSLTVYVFMPNASPNNVGPILIASGNITAVSTSWSGIYQKWINPYSGGSISNATGAYSYDTPEEVSYYDEIRVAAALQSGDTFDVYIQVDEVIDE